MERNKNDESENERKSKKMKKGRVSSSQVKHVSTRGHIENTRGI